MKAPLSEFLMEDLLEEHRFSARFNAGESGHRAQSLGSLLTGLQPDFNFNLQDALSEVMLSDAPNMGQEQLRSLVAQLHPGASPENVLITTGTSEALLLLLRQLRPRKLALIAPAFQLLSEIPCSLGAEILPLPVRWNALGHPEAPIDAWVNAIQANKPDVFIFNHPHNPSGLLLSQQHIEMLLAASASVNCVVIGDEHYRFLSRPVPEPGPTLYARGRFVTGSFIKCAGTPGLRIGWCVGDAQVLQAMQSEKNYLTHTVNPISQLIATWFLQSLQRSNGFFSVLHSEWLENKRTFAQWKSKQDLWNGFEPAGGLVSCVFPRGSLQAAEAGSGLHPSVTSFAALRERGVFLLPLSTFEQTFYSDVALSLGFRLGFGLSTAQFKQMLSVMVRSDL